jgi:diacylglycerol kinase (ATP)
MKPKTGEPDAVNTPLESQSLEAGAGEEKGDPHELVNPGEQGAVPTSRRYLILANPKAGGLKPSSVPGSPQDSDAELAHLKEEVARFGLDAQVENAPPPPQLKSRLQTVASEGFDTVVAAGGDGTVRPIAQALVESPLQFGILPVGTANNFAHSLGIPLTLEGGLQVLRDGRAQKVDVGRMGTEYFTEAAGVGLFANLIAAFGPSGPSAAQWLACLRIVGPMFWNPPGYHLKLVLDGVPYEKDATMVSVCNSNFLGKRWLVAPEALLNDGLFDVVIVGALSRGELLGFLVSVLQGRDLTFPKVTLVRAKTVEISRVRTGRRPLPVHADDHIGSHIPTRLEVVPGGLTVIATQDVGS